MRINLEGNELPHSPGFKAKAGAQYQAALGTGDFATQVGYVSDVATDKMVIQIKSFGELA